MTLTDQQRAILDFERAWWKFQGGKEDAIAAAFEISPVRYYQLLNRCLDDPEALAYAPQTVNRLRRLRGARPSRLGDSGAC